MITGPYDIHLDVPVRTQFEGATSDGRTAENEFDDCNPACDAMILEYETGVHLLVDEMKDIQWQVTGKQPESTGETSVLDAPRTLTERAGLVQTVHYVTTTGDAMKVIRAAIGAGRPLKALVTLTPTVDHFVVVTGAAGPDANHTTTVTINDPNGTDGRQYTMSNTDFFNWLAPNIDGQGGRWLVSIDTAPRR